MNKFDDSELDDESYLRQERRLDWFLKKSFELTVQFIDAEIESVLDLSRQDETLLKIVTKNEEKKTKVIAKHDMSKSPDPPPIDDADHKQAMNFAQKVS